MAGAQRMPATRQAVPTHTPTLAAAQAEDQGRKERRVMDTMHLKGRASELREHCGRFAGRAAALAARRGWPYLAAVLKQFQVGGWSGVV